MHLALIVALAAAAASHPTHHTHPVTKRTTYPNGIATFNNFAAQGNTNCGPTSGKNGAYGAAASDISPGISGGTCPGSVLMSQCAGQSPAPGYQAPGCLKANCGKCYKITNQGGIGGGSIGGVGNHILVQIIDACPSTSAYNFCKTNMPANQRCGDPGTNQLDIDQSAYMALTGQPYGAGPTLNIGIEDADCSGDTSTGDSPAAPVPSSPNDLAPGNPGQHAAGGDKQEEHRVIGGNLAIQGLGSPNQLSSQPSSTLPPPPPPSATPTTALPTSTSGSPNENAAAASDDEDCDEL